MYFSNALIETCFNRLASSQIEGKTHLERTSALMYFLVFDICCKKSGLSILDMNPDTREGKFLRSLFASEYSSLVTIQKLQDPQRYIQVAELGKLEESKTDPAKKISSNFLTVPLKKASTSSTPYSYPNRPSTPILKLGIAATGTKWGIERHEMWNLNLQKLFKDFKYSTPFTDLAIFLLRKNKLSVNRVTYIDQIQGLLEARFTKELVVFWMEKIGKEKILYKHIPDNYHESTYHEYTKTKSTNSNRFKDLGKADILEYIEYLERIIEINLIHFEKK